MHIPKLDDNLTVIVLESTHLFVTNTCKRTWIEGENDCFSSVVSKTDVTLLGVLQGEGGRGISNIDHDEAKNIRRISVSYFKQGQNDQRS